jgi:hypothetical protein
MRRFEKLSDWWLRAFCRVSPVAIGTLSMLFTMLFTTMVSLPALAATSLNFVTSEGGQFSIADGELVFMNDFTISVASVDGISDTSLLDARLTLEPILLTGEITEIEGGFFLIGIVPESLTLEIRQATGAGGALLATATFLPGDLLSLQESNADLVSEIAAGQLILEPAGDTSSVLSSFAASTDPVEIVLALSAAGQDIAALVEAGSPVTGSVAGSMAIIAAPEPSAAALTGAAMATLLLVTSRRRLGRRIEHAKS